MNICSRSGRMLLLAVLVALTGSQAVIAQQTISTRNSAGGDRHVTSRPEAGGLREDIPEKYAKRYQEWKEEFLSTDIGKAQWEMYARHPYLQLTITVGGKNAEGAGTGKYKWNEKGELIAATIMLGDRINEGYPSAVYYPVMNALEPFESRNLIGGSVLAATKIAHEFGHVMKISSTPHDVYHLQLQLVPIYNKIFLSNGYNVNDPRLVDLAQKMGGNPVEIWEDREYWGEANAMIYLRDRFTEERQRCPIFKGIRDRVDLYAKNYEGRFLEIAQSVPSKRNCGW